MEKLKGLEYFEDEITSKVILQSCNAGSINTWDEIFYTMLIVYQYIFIFIFCLIIIFLGLVKFF